LIIPISHNYNTCANITTAVPSLNSQMPFYILLILIEVDLKEKTLTELARIDLEIIRNECT